MQDLRTESVLKALGVKFEYAPEFPMDKLISDPDTQVRREENQGPSAEVERYHKLMSAGAEFPPIVATRRGQLIDGNTRWGAYTAMRRSVIPTYTVDVTSPAVAKRIGVELNAVHGKRMERAELIAWLAAGNGNVTPEVAQRLTGWSESPSARLARRSSSTSAPNDSGSGPSGLCPRRSGRPSHGSRTLVLPSVDPPAG